MARLQSEIENVDWSTFQDRFLWYQGEHVSLIGPTGGGKSTLALALLERRKRSVILATKPRDATLSEFLRKHREYKRLAKWEYDPDKRRVMLWPPIAKPEDMAVQARAMAHAMGWIYRHGGWCVLADELRYLVKNLKLQRYLDLFWLQGRSLGISLVATTQRPAWVPVEMYDQATHLFFWKDNDERNLARIGGLGALNSKLVRQHVQMLNKHDVLYVNTRNDTLLTTRMEL